MEIYVLLSDILECDSVVLDHVGSAISGVVVFARCVSRIDTL